jgi:hypothetical protein
MKDIDALYAQNSNHREALAAADEASCYYCVATFPCKGDDFPDEWTDNGQTALCPVCGIDAVIPGRHPHIVLRAMRRQSFAEHFKCVIPPTKS